ncbi:hypothetical protein BH09PSE5_BH09PSE5_45580 [soil metagenome]
MTTPLRHQRWVDALKKERPWEDNETTRELLLRVGDADIAAIIWALARSNALNWLEIELPVFDGKSASSFLSSDQGRSRVWIALEEAAAWL